MYTHEHKYTLCWFQFLLFVYEWLYGWSLFFRNLLIISYLTEAKYPFLRNHLFPIVFCERVTPWEFDLIFYYIVVIMHLYIFAPPLLKIDSFFIWEEKHRVLSPDSSSFLHIPTLSQFHSQNHMFLNITKIIIK